MSFLEDPTKPLLCAFDPPKSGKQPAGSKWAPWSNGTGPRNGETVEVWPEHWGMTMQQIRELMDDCKERRPGDGWDGVKPCAACRAGQLETRFVGRFAHHLSEGWKSSGFLLAKLRRGTCGEDLGPKSPTQKHGSSDPDQVG